MATTEEIWAAADALQEAGEAPTLVAVRERVGGGSYTTISEAMKKWRKAKETPPVPQGGPVPEGLQKRGEEWLRTLWGEAYVQAQEKLQAERKELESAHAVMEQERVETLKLADALSAELETRVQQLAEKEALLTQQKERILRLQAEAKEARERAAKAEGIAQGLQESLWQLQNRLLREKDTASAD